MRKLLVGLVVGLVLGLAVGTAVVGQAAQPAAGLSTAQRLTKLENQVAALQRQMKTVRGKTQHLDVFGNMAAQWVRSPVVLCPEGSPAVWHYNGYFIAGLAC